MRTYISLFSSAGIGCYGFKMNGFKCVATNELLDSRLNIQRANNKCEYESGYVCGDATNKDTHERIMAEIEKWKTQKGLQQIDVVFATPPCQGMSTANYKKNDHEQIRNSLVVEAIKLIKMIRPKVFVFENVRAFMKSICTDISGDDMLIKDSIYSNLSDMYNIYWKVINFKDYGVPSSRPRTLVIGTSRELNFVTPLHLFPTRQDEIPLKDSIGNFTRLGYCEKDPIDPLHFARPFPKYMLDWIKDLKEGETAFDNPDDSKPYTLDKDGNRIINKGAYMGNKYRRLIWNKPGACIATRSDVMSSQDTIHPCDNRVLSIRELMTLMTIPDSFKWTNHDEELSVKNSDIYLKENECNIRRCIGEAVPTHIGYSIAKKVNLMLDFEDYMKGICSYDECNIFMTMSKLTESHFDVIKAFNNTLILSSDFKVRNIGFEDFDSFILYMPMVSAYFSHVDKVSVDVYLTNETELKKINELLNNCDFGSNFQITMVDQPLYSFYDVRVGKSGCREYKRPTTRGKKKVSSRENDYIQLSLF